MSGRKENTLIMFAGDDSALADVIARIKPLPRSVAPSARFRRQMRRRLLTLLPVWSRDNGAAASRAA